MQNNSFNENLYCYEERMKIELTKMGIPWDDKREVDVLVGETDFVKLYKYWRKKIKKLVNEIKEEYKNNWKKIYDEKIEKEIICLNIGNNEDGGCFHSVKTELFFDYSLYVYYLLKVVDELERAIDLLQDENFGYNIFNYNKSNRHMRYVKCKLSEAIDLYEKVRERFEEVKNVIIKRLEKIKRGNLTDEELLKLEASNWKQI